MIWENIKAFFKRFAPNPIHKLEGRMGVDNFEEKINKKRQKIVNAVDKKIIADQQIIQDALVMERRAARIKSTAQRRVQSYTTLKTEVDIPKPESN